jgi:uridylate kinase
VSKSFKRILLKLGGETLCGEGGQGIDHQVVQNFAKQIKEIHDMKHQIALVLGGGNIFRGLKGVKDGGLDRTTADHMGMMATLINCLALQSVIEHLGVHTRVQSAINVSQVAEPYIRRRAIRHLEKGRVVLFAAGTGNPYFSTDTAAALRAMEIDADVLIKGTKVDGVYDKDPKQHANAQKFEEMTYIDFINRRLTALDTTAVSLCMDNQVPIVVFNIFKQDNLKRLVEGQHLGTWIRNQPSPS